MSNRIYPRILERCAKPSAEIARKEEQNRARDPHYGKPCVCCGKGTTRRIWIQVNMWRGEDEEMRLCCTCWNTPTEELLAIFNRSD